MSSSSLGGAASVPSSALPTEEYIASFGFGSNMNIALLQSKKCLRVLGSAPAIVKGWRLNFSLSAISLVEPSFADAQRGAADDEIHGVVAFLPPADYAKLAAQESAYGVAEVPLTTYDGRAMTGRLFTKLGGSVTAPDIPCSARYLNVLVQGAREAGLDSAYIQRLASTPTYQPTQDTLARRAALPSPASLPAITVVELREAFADPPRGRASAEDASTRTAVLGYVFELPRKALFFGAHRGRDITARASRQWQGISLDENDDLGDPRRFPPVKAMPAGEREFVSNWLDHYLARANIVGFLAEFKQHLEAEGH
jgi:hypothetical protein